MSRVRDRWTLLDSATARERIEFADLATTLDAPSSPAAPPNRFRRVHRIELPGEPAAEGPAVYFLKQFDHTQRKNALRNRLTRPRCALDADREFAVGAALRARGIATARPVAVGARADGASFYLCAERDGAPVSELLTRGDWSARADRDLARFCGNVMRAGVVLTDLSADHVFASGSPAGAWDFAVIDLHNGREGRATRRELVRLLRRFARSVRGVDIPRRRAIRFAVSLLAAAGAADRRGVLERLPPFDTHGRYDAGTRATRYRDRNPARTARELALLRGVWPGRPGDSILDVPCGAGRLAATIRDLGCGWSGADRSTAMLDVARSVRPDASFALADAGALPFQDGAFDGVVVFRFLHHVDDRVAERVVAEAARVARRFVVVTWFHPVSAHHLTRSLRRMLGGSTRTRFARTAAAVRGWLASSGLTDVCVDAEARFRRDLWIAAAQRPTATSEDVSPRRASSGSRATP